MRTIFILGALAAAVPSAAFAGDPSQTAAPVVGASSAEGDKVICKRRKEPDVGTHMRARPTCMKASDWRELEVLTENAKRRFEDRFPGTIDTRKKTMGGGGGLN